MIFVFCCVLCCVWSEVRGQMQKRKISHEEEKKINTSKKIMIKVSIIKKDYN
jgi:hypothetical protein